MESKHIAEEDLPAILKNLRTINPRVYSPQKISFPDKHVKFGVIADAHMGHQAYRPDVLENAAKKFKDEGVEFVLNAGDTIEGMSGRDGHIYELAYIGATAQMDYFADEFKKLGDWPVYSIEANDSHGGWFKSKGNTGLDIGPELQTRAPNYRFVGYDEQDILLDNGLKIRLRHPGMGCAYAISYKLQKYIESIGGADKPNILIQGHFHKAEYIFYRNIHALDAGTLQNQSNFMKKIGTPAHVGYWVLDVHVDEKGVNSLKLDFTPFYD